MTVVVVVTDVRVAGARWISENGPADGRARSYADSGGLWRAGRGAGWFTACDGAADEVVVVVERTSVVEIGAVIPGRVGSPTRRDIVLEEGKGNAGAGAGLGELTGR